MPVSPTRFPKFIAPQVPILSAEPPECDGWIHEIKHDGFRTLLRIDRGDIRAFAIVTARAALQASIRQTQRRFGNLEDPWVHTSE
jgi:hypothetical protein